MASFYLRLEQVLSKVVENCSLYGFLLYFLKVEVVGSAPQTPHVPTEGNMGLVGKGKREC